MLDLKRVRVFALLAAWIPALAAAHVGDAAPGWTWSFEPWVVLPMLAALGAYATGTARLWLNAGRGRGLGAGNVASFAAGWLCLAAALVSPLDALSAQLFSAHMLQHEALMLLAAPLFVLGRPLAAWAWALPARARKKLPAALHAGCLAPGWAAITDPIAAWALHALALWAWHVPAAFEAALHSEGVHVLQHTSFLASALLFWWAVLGPDARARREGLALLLLFTTMLHTGALGALLSLAPTPWYPHYVTTAVALGVDPVEDQQLGGLIMWIPCSAVYLAAALHVVGRLLRRGAGAVA